MKSNALIGIANMPEMYAMIIKKRQNLSALLMRPCDGLAEFILAKITNDRTKYLPLMLLEVMMLERPLNCLLSSVGIEDPLIYFFLSVRPLCLRISMGITQLRSLSPFI